MRTAIRRPRSTVAAMLAALAGAVPGNVFHINRPYTRGSNKAPRLGRGGTSRYRPHQGAQEKARRVRQMAAGTHGYPV